MDKDSINDDQTVEFTLEDAYGHLRDSLEEVTREMENLMHRSSNNETATIAKGLDHDEIRARYHKLIQGLSKSFVREDPKDLPIPNTIDLHKTMIRDIDGVLGGMQQLYHGIERNIAAAKKNIAYLESNKEGLEKMRGACLGAIESVGSNTDQEEIVLSKRLFHDAKDDLLAVVDTIFPGDNEFKDVLHEVTRAYAKGGDQIYIDVKPESYPFVKFLVEADLAAYHRNDKTKIRLMELL